MTEPAGLLRAERAFGLCARLGCLLSLLVLFSAFPAHAEGPPGPQVLPSPARTSSPLRDAATRQATRAVLWAARGDLERARRVLATLPEGPRTDLARGVLAEIEGRRAEAARLYRRAEHALPAEAAFRRGNLALQDGQPAQAIGHFRRALRHSPDHALAHYHLALALEAHGQAEEALPHLDRTLELDPPQTQQLVRAVTRGRHAALEVAPVNLLRSRALLTRGRLRLALGRPGAAEDLQASPDLAAGEASESLFLLGQEALSRGDVGEAALWLQACLETSLEPTGIPTDLAVWGPGAIMVRQPDGRMMPVRSLRLGVTPSGWLVDQRGGTFGIRLPEGSYDLQVDRDGTLRVWQPEAVLPRAVGRLPLSDDQAHVLSGFRERDPRALAAWELLHSLGSDTENLVRILPFMSASDQIALLAPMAEGPMAPLAQARLAALYFGRFQASRRMEDLQEARRRWQSLRRSHPDLQFPALNLATIALLDRQFDEATALLTGLRDAHSARTLPDTLLIQLLMALGEWDAALQAVEEARQRTPNGAFPRLARVEILAARGQTSQALSETEALLSDLPDLLEARYLQVRLLGRMGSVVRQQAELEDLLESDPAPYRALRMLGSLLDRLGRTSQALDLYRRYLATPEALVYETEEWVSVEVRVRELRETIR